MYSSLRSPRAGCAITVLAFCLAAISDARAQRPSFNCATNTQPDEKPSAGMPRYRDLIAS